jgi:DNA-binding IclR family transcriptional regulator
VCPEQRADSEQTSVVRRLAAVLDAFGPADVHLGVNELARRTGIPNSTVSRLIKDMERAGFIERAGSKVGLGLRLFEWGERASRRRSVREVALPFMADLREATHQTIHLAVLDGIEVVYVEILESAGGPWLPSKVGGRLPAHATGVGKALLALSSPQIVRQAMATGLPEVGPRTIRSAKLLQQQLSRVSAIGIAYEQQESAHGVVCVASAITDNAGRPIAAISASGWAGRVDIRRVAPAVRTAALSITRLFAAPSL